MKCPACNNQLQSTQYKNYILDFCAVCGGIWFDKGELKDTVNSLISDNEVDYQTVKEALNKKPIDLKSEQHLIRQCPKCNGGMKIFNYSYDSNIFIDKCPSCEGVWTDMDEIKQIAKYNKGNPKVDAMGKSVAEAYKRYLENKLKTEEFMDLGGKFSIGKFLLWRVSLFPIPLKDENPIKKIPVVTLSLILFNVIIFLYQLFFVHEPETYVRLVGLTPSGAFQSNRLFTFISSMFVHGGFWHILGNMYFLWLFGDNIEDEWGSIKFLLFYLLCGIIGSLTFIGVHPNLNEPAVGASGAISGILGAYIILYPDVEVSAFWLGRIRGISAFGYLLYWVLFQALFGVIEICSKTPSYIAYWDHLGGFFCGVLIAYIVKKKILSRTVSANLK